mmetsp:Transcript_7644/g.18872  ORF Transcript_7644/g.18872 Transcript_7644/m.18872 type:complete len:342 (+) Transcript_7644:580-1605(+)
MSCGMVLLLPRGHRPPRLLLPGSPVKLIAVSFSRGAFGGALGGRRMSFPREFSIAYLCSRRHQSFGLISGRPRSSWSCSRGWTTAWLRASEKEGGKLSRGGLGLARRRQSRGTPRGDLWIVFTNGFTSIGPQRVQHTALQNRLVFFRLGFSPLLRLIISHYLRFHRRDFLLLLFLIPHHLGIQRLRLLLRMRLIPGLAYRRRPLRGGVDKVRVPEVELEAHPGGAVEGHREVLRVLADEAHDGELGGGEDLGFVGLEQGFGEQKGAALADLDLEVLLDGVHHEDVVLLVPDGVGGGAARLRLPFFVADTETNHGAAGGTNELLVHRAGGLLDDCAYNALEL